MGKELLRPDEAARLLNVSWWTIYRWVKEGRLEATKVGRGSLRVFNSSIEQLVQEKRVKMLQE